MLMRLQDRIPPPLGVVRRYHRVESLILVEHVYPEMAARGQHAHSWFHVTLVQCGYYARVYGSREEVYSSGMLSLLPNEEQHTDRYAPGSKCLHLAVLDSVRQRLPEPGELATHAIPPLLAAMFCAALQHEFEHCDTDSALILELLLADLLSSYAGLRDDQSRVKPDWLGRLIDYLDDTFTETWNLKELACHAGVHPVHLCRSFREHFHCTLGQYIRSLRLLRARQLIADRSVGLAEIAAMCGFADQSHLQREFKKVVGTSPSLYRRNGGTPRR